ncbi:MAG: tetratricopeptide repeat protein [Panacagrimonas sp.]
MNEPERVSFTLEQALEYGRGLRQRGGFREALEFFGQVTTLWPDSADAWHFLGLLRFEMDEEIEGIATVRTALKLAPDYADAHANLGNMLLNRSELDAAQQHLHRALALDPSNFAPRVALSIVFRALSRLDEADAILKPALELAPDSAAVHNSYANVLTARGDIEGALLHCRRAMELAPELAGSEHRLGVVLAYSGKLEAARNLFRNRLERFPDDVGAQHMLAACEGIEAPTKANPVYVRTLFNGFAASFDSKLAHLEYRAPELIAGVAASLLGEATASLDVLDAGCGTGLLGPLIHTYCKRLDGVDLSPGMLDRARPRAVYDELVEAELTAFLRRRVQRYDVVASADTLCYFGALEEVFAAAHLALHPDGWLLFSVEHDSTQDAGFRLQFHGRYAHRRDYVENGLSAAGFARIVVTEDTLRMDAGKPVPGLIVAAQRGS